jgi:hypothetical protein
LEAEEAEEAGDVAGLQHVRRTSEEVEEAGEVVGLHQLKARECALPYPKNKHLCTIAVMTLAWLAFVPQVWTYLILAYTLRRFTKKINIYVL